MEEKTLPKKDSGYHFVGSECTSGAKASWNELSWSVSVSNLSENGTSCTLKFEKKELNFDYGDGSLNTVSRSCELNGNSCGLYSGDFGYKDKVYVYDLVSGNDKKLESVDVEMKKGGNYNGNYYPLNGTMISSPMEILENNNSLIMKKGENIYTTNVQTADDSIIYLNFNIFGQGPLNNLEQAVNNKKIKPLVIIFTLDRIGDNPVNLYNGGTLSGYFNYLRIYFMLENNVSIKGMKFNSGVELRRSSGHISIQKIENKILHLK